MPKTKISEFSATPANNTDIDSINIAEGCAPSGINDAIRELMSQLKDFQTGAVGDSFNGPVGSTTASTGAFTTLSASSTVSGTGFSTYLASPPAIGGTAAAAVSATTLAASGAVTLSGGTANGVTYLNGSKVLTSGSALTFDGTNFATSGTSTASKLIPTGTSVTGNGMYLPATNSLGFSTAGVNAAYIDANQNVGIGVTPSAWRSAYNVTYGERALEVTYSALVTQAGPSTILANNVYFNSSNQWIYKNAVANTNAGLYTIGSDGLHTWSVAPTGASGAVATMTQVLSINKDKSLALQGATAATGIGITFPATQSASSDANTLDDYEEGTWTPSDGSGAGLSLSATFATYTKVGRLVTCNAKIDYPTTASTATTRINGLPFTSSSNNHAASTMFTDSGTYFTNLVVESASFLLPYNLTGAQLTNVNLSGKRLIFTVLYIV